VTTPASHSIALRNARVAAPEGLVDGDLLIVGDRIESLGRIRARSGTIDRDVGGLIVGPGLVDLQVNGLAGAEVYDATGEVLRAIARQAPSMGCTSFLATMTSAPRGLYAKLFAAYAETPQTTGARLLGIHLEGPYLNPSWHGAHLSEAVRNPSAEEAGEILRESRGAVKLWTLAPELPGAADLIGCLIEKNVRVAIGHSAASFSEANTCFDNGVGLVTHLFNAMPAFHHRDPGLVGATLLHASIHFSVIADGIHVDPPVLELAYRLAPSRLILITDATAAAGSGPGGRCAVAGRVVTVENGAPRLPDGRLAGSALEALQAVRNLAQWTSASLVDALAAMTARPADVLGLEDVGRLAEGAFADLLLLDDDGRLLETWVGGRPLYLSPSSRTTDW
jgi:N-acetylglucosamine-6-phosphate deacetylase